MSITQKTYGTRTQSEKKSERAKKRSKLSSKSKKIKNTEKKKPYKTIFINLQECTSKKFLNPTPKIFQESSKLFLNAKDDKENKSQKTKYVKK